MTRTELIFTDPTIDEIQPRVEHALRTLTSTARPHSEITLPDDRDKLTRKIRARLGVPAVGLAIIESGPTLIVIDNSPSGDAIDQVIDNDIDLIINASERRVKNRGPSRLVKSQLDRGTLVVGPDHVTMPRDTADNLLNATTDHADHQDANADETDADGKLTGSRSVTDLPGSTEWVGGHPAPAAGTEHGGRPPVGYRVSRGELRPSDEYPTVRAALVALDDDATYRDTVAQKIDVSETTVKRILYDPERRARYALDVRVDADQ